jgi:hypothetical protein
MPYLGLWQGNHELEAREYKRIDLHDAEFVLADIDFEKDDAEVDFVFVNTNPIRFATALSDWGKGIRIALFRYPADTAPVVLLDPLHEVHRFDTVYIPHRGLRLQQFRTKWSRELVN